MRLLLFCARVIVFALWPMLFGLAVRGADVWTLAGSFQPTIESIDPGSGSISPIALSDGSVLVRTSSPIVNGKQAGHVVHLLADGTVDPAFQFPGKAALLGVAPDGKLLVHFASSSDGLTGYVYRLLPTGAADLSFQPIKIVNGTRLITHVQADGRILLFGSFTSVNGMNSYNFARLNSDGTVDPLFSSPFTASSTGTVNSACEQSDGRIVLVGGFDIGGQWTTIARLNPNGSLDYQLPLGWLDSLHLNGAQVQVLADDRFLATTTNTVVRFNADGSKDAAYVPKPVGNPSGSYYLTASGRAYYLDSTAGVNTLRRLNGDGTPDANFTITTPVGLGYAATLPVTWDERTFYIPSALTASRKDGRQFLTQVDASGAIVSSFSPRFSNYAVPYVAGRTTDGAYLIQATADYVNGAKIGGVANNLFRIRADGSLDASFPALPNVAPVSLEPDGHFVATSDENGATVVARYGADGSKLTTYDVPSTTHVLTSDSIGRVYAVGSNNVLVRYKADGHLDTTFTSPLTNYPGVVLPTLDGKVFVGDGSTQVPGNVPIVRLLPSGAIDPTFATVSPGAAYLGFYAALPDGGLLIEQEFYDFGPAASLHFIRYDKTGKQVYTCDLAKNALAVAGLIYDQLQTIGAGGEVAFRTPPSGQLAYGLALPYWLDVSVGGEFTMTLSLPEDPDGSLARYTRSGNIQRSAVQAPTIAIQPSTLTSAYDVGASVTLSIAALGEAPLQYQWLRNGSPLNRGSTVTNTTNLSLSNLQATDAGSYSVVVSNPWGSVTSSASFVGLRGPPVIGTQPISQLVRLGNYALFSVSSPLRQGLSYVWQTRGPNEASWSNVRSDSIYGGMAGPSLSVYANDVALSGRQFRCVLTNSDGSTTSDEVSITVRESTDYSGAYFGSFTDSSGRWALKINADRTGTFIATLTDRNSVVVTPVVVSDTGVVTATGAELPAARAAGSIRSLSIGTDGTVRSALSSAAPFALSARIDAFSFVSGTLNGAYSTLTGSADAASASPLAASFLTATALGTAEGNLYAVVGPDGQALVVTVVNGVADYATGTVDSSGRLSATSMAGATVALNLTSGGSAIGGTISPAGPASPVTYAGLSDQIFPVKRLVNISTRALGGTGNNVAIGGFVVAGNGTKKFLIRGVGPTLTSLNIPTSEVMLDPTMALHDVLHSTVLGTNDDWGDNPNALEISATAAQIGATAFAQGDTKSSAMLVSLSPGVYSFVVGGKSNTTGVVLAEVYDAETANANLRLINISARARATTGNGVAIGGFVVSGNAPKKLLVRGVGPTLSTLGLGTGEILADPIIEVHDALHNNAVVATNDNWTDNANASESTAAAARVGATALVASDVTSSALLLTLQPGVYSFVASGKNGTSGIVLVEVYDAD